MSTDIAAEMVATARRQTVQTHRIYARLSTISFAAFVVLSSAGTSITSELITSSLYMPGAMDGTILGLYAAALISLTASGLYSARSRTTSWRKGLGNFLVTMLALAAAVAGFVMAFALLT
jgi:hypothetical protein